MNADITKEVKRMPRMIGGSRAGAQNGRCQRLASVESKWVPRYPPHEMRWGTGAATR
jgi:hypothetical protein